LFERALLGDARARLCAQATGDVLEVAVGTGRNLPFYPPGIRLTAVDLSPAMLGIAGDRARRLGRPVRLTEGDAEVLPFADRSFDTVVCTLSLCTIPDDLAAVTQMYRVLRPSGRLLLLDHVRAEHPAVLFLQRTLSLLTRRDNLLRRPLHRVEAQGFVVEQRSRTKAGSIEWLVARKPARASTG
jgi:ubiquinone/menaquinone biosynthesis C-methylase UbiE